MRILLACFFMSLCAKVAGQKDTSRSTIDYSGYLEGYYCYDASEPQSRVRNSFIYSHNKHNEPNINLGFLKASWKKGDYRANLAFMVGTYATANLANEAPGLRNIFEANFGFRLPTKYEIWVDVGVMPSHIGFESAVSNNCWTLTRSILADNSPYYESGLRISSTYGKWYLAVLLLNGWQQIYRPDQDNYPALGHQLTYKPNKNVSLNSSSFWGTNYDGINVPKTRLFHNFYGQFQLHKKLGMQLGFDIGAQQKTSNYNKFDIWYSPAMILRFVPKEKFRIAARAEWYHDPGQVIVSTGTPNGFSCKSYSLNFDYQLRKNMLARIEQRWFNSRDPIFPIYGFSGLVPVKSNSAFTASLSLSF